MSFVVQPKLVGKTVPLQDMMDGLAQFLATRGVAFDTWLFTPVHPSRDYPVGGTQFELRGIVEDGNEWPDQRYIFFGMLDKICKSRASRIGPGPIDLLLVASRLTQWKDLIPTILEECRVILDISVSINPDRSIAFSIRDPARRYEGGYIVD